MSDSKGMLRKGGHAHLDFTDGGDSDRMDGGSMHHALAQFPAGDQAFSISSSILVPGMKHMLDNIQKDALSKLSWYPTFAAAWCGKGKGSMVQTPNFALFAIQFYIFLAQAKGESLLLLICYHRLFILYVLTLYEGSP